MLKGNAQVIFRVVIGLVFIGLGVKYCIEGDYLFGGISLVAGAAFAASPLIKKGGNQK
jgi:hypothetical protein